MFATAVGKNSKPFSSQAKMSSRLQDHFVVLCQQLNVDRVLPILRQEKMVTMDEYETLTNPMLSTRQKREKLLIILPRKGKHHFEKFGACLVWSGQEQLAQTIGIDVSNVNPRPANGMVPPPPPPQLPLASLLG